VEAFYNLSHPHSALGYLSPIEYERKHDALTKPAEAAHRPQNRVNPDVGFN
jgi:transposase InsO family protein